MEKRIKKHITILVMCIMLLCLSACNLAENHTGKPQAVHASVIEFESFGHAVLDLSTADLLAAGYELGDIVHVRFGSYESDMPFFDGYYISPGAALLRGLSPEENIALCINYGEFHKETGITLGEAVEITMAEKAGMLSIQELYALNYSNTRTDYSDDAVFANFRSVTAGRIGNGKLYRSASPISNEHGRAGYANQLIADAGVATVLNLADSNEDILEYCNESGFNSAYYLALYESGNVTALNLTANFFSDSFAASVADGLTFLAKKEPPYCIHCTEGKDRAGFTLMLLEALMGAELQEIIDDYMLSFYNYYGIDKEKQPERYEAVLNNNLMPMLYHVTGADSEETLAQIDLESAVTSYLLKSGMTENAILTLKEKLS